MFSKMRKISEAIGHAGNAWTFAGFIGWQAKLTSFGLGMLTWAATFFGAAGEGLSVTAVWVLSLAAGVLAAVLVLFVAMIIAVLRRPAAPASTESKPSVFRYEKDAFVESKRIKWSDGSTSELYEENYYLPVWHSLATGQPLKAVKARLFMIGQEPIPARVKETGQYSVDLRHGEVALFKIGRVISTDGFYSGGYVTFSDEEKKQYQHFKPNHGKHFEVFSESRRAFGIGDARPSGSPETHWLNVVVSADDVVSLSVSVFFDFYGKRLIRFEDQKDDPKNGE